MKIIADENIPYAVEAFSGLGEVYTCAGRDMTKDIVADADALMVRSVTKVDRDLLEGSSVKYVGTATIGVDHIDLDYLKVQNIAFASAPGSNANSVSEWVTAALLEYAVANGVDLRGKTLGIIGVGNVGSRVKVKADALGMRVLLNDPPRARTEGGAAFISLADMLPECDFVTVHVPLNREGVDSTAGLANGRFFNLMRRGAVFLNSSRGGVVEEDSLLSALREGMVAVAMLDVWRGEPEISKDTLQSSFIGTPHIAGYSFDGKVAGTNMIYDAACNALQTGELWDPAGLLPEPEVPLVSLGNYSAQSNPMDVLRYVVCKVYPIMVDDKALRQYLEMDHDECGSYFTRLRKEYPRRREFRFTRVELPFSSNYIDAALAGLGFAI